MTTDNFDEAKLEKNPNDKDINRRDKDFRDKDRRDKDFRDKDFREKDLYEDHLFSVSYSCRLDKPVDQVSHVFSYIADLSKYILWNPWLYLHKDPQIDTTINPHQISDQHQTFSSEIGSTADYNITKDRSAPSSKAYSGMPYIADEIVELIPNKLVRFKLKFPTHKQVPKASNVYLTVTLGETSEQDFDSGQATPDHSSKNSEEFKSTQLKLEMSFDKYGVVAMLTKGINSTSAIDSTSADSTSIIATAEKLSENRLTELMFYIQMDLALGVSLLQNLLGTDSRKFEHIYESEYIMSPQKMVYVDVETHISEITQHLDKVQKTLTALLKANKVSPKSALMAEYIVDFDSMILKAKLMMLVDNQAIINRYIDSDYDVSTAEFAGGLYLKAVHKGSYQTLNSVYPMLERNASALDMELDSSRGPLEIYVSSASNTDDDNSYETHALMPIKPKY